MIQHELPLRFGDDDLIPAVIVDADSGDVLMVGFMNEEALFQTRTTGLVHFWSRSRSELWKKGGTSGHVQDVVQIRLNCDRNTLLIDVHQHGAVCHDGYATCFYRRLEPDNSLTVLLDRQFDPADVYGGGTGIAATVQRWWRAYEVLRDTDFTTESGTSRLLRADTDSVTARIIDELRELAGALDGTHRHQDQKHDVALEAGQVCYWLALRCIREGLTVEAVRPDRSLDPANAPAGLHAHSLAAILRVTANSWESGSASDLASAAHETFALAAAACAVIGIDPVSLIRADLDELRTRPYLRTWFEQAIPVI